VESDAREVTIPKENPRDVMVVATVFSFIASIILIFLLRGYLNLPTYVALPIFLVTFRPFVYLIAAMIEPQRATLKQFGRDLLVSILLSLITGIVLWLLE